MIFSGIGQVFGQTETPCGCSNFIEIGTTGELTDLSLYDPFETSRCYLLKGILHVTETTDWIGVRIQMEESAQIVTEEELSLHDTYISGCGFMWKGIKAETNIFLYDSFIEDAEFGVKLENTSGIVCLNTDFINDYIGISVGSPFAADQFGQVIYRCQIWGCSFYTVDNLPNPYPGQYYYPSWPTTPTQIPYDQGFAAIFLSGVTIVNIGLKDSDEENRNQVYQMRNGIIMRNSEVKVYGTDFFNFEGSQVRTPAEPVLDLNQYAVNSFRSHSLIIDNTVDNILVGVFANESNSTIQNNQMNLPVTSTTRALTKGIHVNTPQTLLVDNNNIINGWRGILLENVHTPFKMVHNTLTRNINKPINIGIDIRTVKYETNALGLVQDNYINIADGNGAFDIYINNASQIKVDDNHVHFDDVLGNDDKNRGIVVVGAGGSSFTQNDVDADAGYNDIDNFGFELFFSFQNGLTCNDIGNFEHNLQITGPNMQTDLITNLIHDGSYGLYLESPVMIGT